MEAESFSPGYHPAFGRGEVELHTIEPTVHEQSDLREFVGLVKRHAPLIALVTIATAAVAFAMSLTQQSVYQSSTTLLYSPTSTAAANPTDTATEMETISGIATSTTVLAPIAKRYGISLPKLQQDLSVGSASTSGSTSELLKISAKAHHATASASIANAVAASLASFRAAREKSLLDSQITFMRQQLSALSGKTDPSSVAAASDIRTQLVNLRASLATFSPDLSVLTPAMVPGAAISPKPTRNGAIGLIVGLVLGIMLGVLRDRLDRRTRSVEEVEGVYRAPLLGTVPFNRRSAPRAELLADFAGSDLLAHAYRTIRTNLSLFRLDKTKKSVIVVTSAVPSEGKSAVAANLAHALSVTGLKILAVSADLHDPTLHDYFADRVPTAGAPMIPILQRSDVLRAQAAQQREAAGLVQVLAGDLSLAEGVRNIALGPRERASGGSLALLANGSTFFDPAALFGSGHMRRFLQQAKQQYDVIVIDTPPLLANADASLLAQDADLVVVVARLNHLTRNQARRAMRVMSAAHLAPTGIIVTGAVDDSSYGYGYSHRYGSGSEEQSGEAASGQPARSGA